MEKDINSSSRIYLHKIPERTFLKWLLIRNKYKVTDKMIADNLGINRVTVNRLFNRQVTRKSILIKIDYFLNNYEKIINENNNDNN